MTVDIMIGDVLAQLKTLPANHVQTVVTSPPYYAQRSYLPADHPDKALEIGLEPTPEAYIAKMVEVFTEVRRVLRKDGTLWLNIGDTSASGGRGGGGSFSHDREAWAERSEVTGWRSTAGLKRKDIIGIPWMLAFALRDSGWHLRSEIIWEKPNAFPESVADRPTRAHEQIFLLSKSGRDTIWRARDTMEWCSTPDLSERIANPSKNPEAVAGKPMVNRWAGFDYYYDLESIMEPSSPNTHARAVRGRRVDHKWADGPGAQTIARRSPSAGRMPGVGPKSAEMGDAGRVKANPSFQNAISGEILPMRNKRSVWSVHTAQYSDAHYATFPPALIVPCILAGAPKGGIVLDPFGGSGTTGEVADMLGRNAILIDLDPDCERQIRNRLRGAHRRKTTKPVHVEGQLPLDLSPPQETAA